MEVCMRGKWKEDIGKEKELLHLVQSAMKKYLKDYFKKINLREKDSWSSKMVIYIEEALLMECLMGRVKY